MACNKVCAYNGQMHVMGERFNSVDGCNTCLCHNDGSYTCTTEPCMSKVCDYNGKAYNVGEGFPADDGCNRCFCAAGGVVACTKMYCPPTTKAAP